MNHLQERSSSFNHKCIFLPTKSLGALATWKPVKIIFSRASDRIVIISIMITVPKKPENVQNETEKAKAITRCNEVAY